MKTCNTAHEGLVADLLRHEFAPDASLVPVPTYPDTIVYEAIADDRRVIFKAMDPDGRDRDGIALEAWSCDRARESGVPAPDVVVLDTSCSRFPTSFYVMAKAAGRTLEGASLRQPDLAAVLTELGTHLRALHEITIPGFGWLDEDHFRATGLVRGSAETWPNALFEAVPQSLDYLRDVNALSASEVEHARKVLDVGAPLLSDYTDGRLLHGDMGLLHVWFDPETRRVTSLVDFGERSSGDPAYDFIDFEPSHLAHVAAGYGDLSDRLEERVRFYALAQAIPWARKWHERGETQVIDSLRGLLRTTEG